MAQESSLKIHDIRIAVENPGQVFAFTHTAFHQLQGIFRRKHIPGIHKYQIIACCQVYTLVHRIIESFVGLRYYHNLMRILTSFSLVLIGSDHRQSLILGAAIHDDVFYITIRLALDTVQCTLQYGCSIIGTGNN